MGDGGGEAFPMRLILLLLLLVAPVLARYAPSDLADIPVERLLQTAETRVKKEPKNAQAWFNLGRIAALAYATQASTLSAEKQNLVLPAGPEGAWPPEKVTTPVTPAARKHLEKAIAAYARTAQLDPSLFSARLSYGWALEQAGEKGKAIGVYRALVKQAWPEEKKRGSSWGRSVSREAAGYLIGLLDQSKDAAEIASLEQIRAEAAKLPRMMTPVLVPLEEAPFEELVDANSPVRFDLDGSGRQLRWGWLTPKAAWLVFLEKRERVESALQLFGSVSFLAFWENGYEALSALDEDGDGLLQGRELRGLKLWRDADCDGVSSPDELLTLEAAGITALDTRCQRRDGYLESVRGVRYRDGRSGPSYDWIRP